VESMCIKRQFAKLLVSPVPCRPRGRFFLAPGACKALGLLIKAGQPPALRSRPRLQRPETGASARDWRAGALGTKTARAREERSLGKSLRGECLDGASLPFGSSVRPFTLVCVARRGSVAWARRFPYFVEVAASQFAGRASRTVSQTAGSYSGAMEARRQRDACHRNRFCDPAEAAQALRDLPFLTFLDSAMADRKLGRYSFIAADPFARIVAGVAGADWAARLKSQLAAYRTASLPGLPPFQGGAAGLFSYELGRSLERLPQPAVNTLAFPDLSLGIYDVTVAFDVIQRRAFILSTGFPEIDEPARERRAIERGRWFEAKLRKASIASPAGPISLDGWTSNFTRASYERMVREVIERILSGDIFQANVAQRFEAPCQTASIISASTAVCACSIRPLFRPISRMKISPSPRPRPKDF